jgi:hypothetical protein
MSNDLQTLDPTKAKVPRSKGRWELARDKWEKEFLPSLPQPAQTLFLDPPCVNVQYFGAYAKIIKCALFRTDNSFGHLIAAQDFANAWLRSTIYARLPAAILENAMLPAARSLLRELLKDGSRGDAEIAQLADQYAHLSLRDEVGLAEVMETVSGFCIELVEAQAVCESLAKLELAGKYLATLDAVRERATHAFLEADKYMETPEEAAEREKAEKKRLRESDKWMKTIAENDRKRAMANQQIQNNQNKRY